MNVQQIKDYYSNEFVINQLLANAKNREVAGALWHGGYEKRPNILQYPSDIKQMIKRGVTSFHFSVEHWDRPMQLKPTNYNDLRIGWDFLIDIDSKLGIKEAKLAALLITKLLEKYGIKYGIKFSGRRGFHILVPWASFPNEINYSPLAKKYPAVPRMIAEFIRSRISEQLLRELRKRSTVKDMIKKLGEIPEELDPFYFVEVEKDWGNRHMFRAPFSLNEKTWLVSLPLKPSRVKSFVLADASPKNVLASEATFFPEKSDAASLLTDAMDFAAMQKKEEKKEKKIVLFEKRVPEIYFPPCVSLVLRGLSEGRKRSLFTLITYLRMMNWSWEEIEKRVFEWNEKNKPPLPRNIVLGQLRWHIQNSRTPANCDSDLFYKGIGICQPDVLCRRVKNPITYGFLRSRTSSASKVRGFSCGICEKEFSSVRSLKAHKSRIHGVL